MSINYAKQLPTDKNGQTMQEFPTPFQALASTARENASASSVTSLNDNTTVVEVTAVTTGAGIRWGNNQATSVITAQTGANFDNYVPEGVTRRFVVPRSSAAITSIAGVNVQEGLFNSIATKSSGVGSVLLTQY